MDLLSQQDERNFSLQLSWLDWIEPIEQCEENLCWFVVTLW